MNTRWFQLLAGACAPALRLYCFPFAGAGHTAYRHWRAALPDDMVLALVKLPGRGARFTEPPGSSIEALADEIADAIASEATHPCALFGHSMGALLAFETARRLSRAGRPPALLAVSGRGAPSMTPQRPRVSDLPEPAFLEHLRAMQGLPAELLDDPESLRFFLPIIRSDFALCEAHRHRPQTPLTCPVLVLAGDKDTGVPLDALPAWQRETHGVCDTRVLPGGHFFVFDHEAQVLGLLQGHARASLEPAHAAA